MEEDLYQTNQTELTPSEKRVQARLEKVIDKAEERNKYESAHNPDILGALNIVKQFLVSRRRVCYGGTAMNAILPPKRRFYDPEMDLPDYDFFTPDPKADVEELVQKLKKAGYKDVYHKVGVHEGTTKVLVNFVPIADITAISEDIYAVFLKRAFKKEKVYYTDPDILRMMMYLEMSRPRGDVSRWNKVFERLQLINSVFPPTFKRSRALDTRKSKGYKVEPEIWSSIYDYCITNQRIVFTGQLDFYYKKVIRFSTPKFNINDYSMPIGFISPNLKDDARTLQTLLGGSEKCKLYIHAKRGEIVPEHIEVRYNNLPVAILLQETACHAYLNFPLSDGRSIAIASLDTLITIYYSISIFTKRLKMLIPGVDSKIATFVMLDEENRGYANPKIPAFPINCIGYQKGWPTLLREKMVRLKAMKEANDL
jgi:hypothetical protein